MSASQVSKLRRRHAILLDSSDVRFELNATSWAATSRRYWQSCSGASLLGLDYVVGIIADVILAEACDRVL